MRTSDASKIIWFGDMQRKLESLFFFQDVSPLLNIYSVAYECTWVLISDSVMLISSIKVNFQWVWRQLTCLQSLDESA